MLGYCVKHHLTQTQVAAAKLGAQQPRVSRLETGEHTPSAKMLQRLARTLGLRFIVEVAPADEGPPAITVTLPLAWRLSRM